MTDSSGHLPRDPAPIERRHELLSAMVDGELSGDELVELEQLAVDEGTTLDAMAGDYQRVHDALSGSILVFRAPSDLRTQHLAVALDAAEDTGVVSLAAARADRLLLRRADGARRLQWLGGVAAAAVLVTGIGLAAGVGRGGDASEQAGTAARDGDTAELSRDSEPTTASAATEELRAESTNDGSSADAFAADEANSVAGGAVTTMIVEGVAPADLPSVVEFEPTRDQAATGEATAGLACGGDAATLGTVDGFAVVLLDDQVYEVFRLDSGETAVFDQGDCTRVD